MQAAAVILPGFRIPGGMFWVVMDMTLWWQRCPNIPASLLTKHIKPGQGLLQAISSPTYSVFKGVFSGQSRWCVLERWRLLRCQSGRPCTNTYIYAWSVREVISLDKVALEQSAVICNTLAENPESGPFKYSKTVVQRQSPNKNKNKKTHKEWKQNSHVNWNCYRHTASHTQWNLVVHLL